NGWRHFSLSRSATMRGSASAAPPGGKGTTKRTGLAGHSCAATLQHARASRNKAARRTLRLIIMTGLEAFLVSTGIVALAEMGDKTQLLAFVLAARFRKPAPIIAGIFAATLVNH